MRHWSRKNKQRLTRQFRVEHIATKVINEMLAKKKHQQGRCLTSITHRWGHSIAQGVPILFRPHVAVFLFDQAINDSSSDKTINIIYESQL